MNERTAFIRAICEQPGDDTPRLVFADWLDENGEAAYAAYIRNRIAGNKARPWASFSRQMRTLMAGRDGLPSKACDWRWERGFIYLIELQVHVFVAKAADIFRLAPITRVILTDCASEETWPGRFTWGYEQTPGDTNEPDRLPQMLFRELIGAAGGDTLPPYPERLDGFTTFREADVALCAAAVRFGRKAAGLPPLLATVPA